MIGSVQGQVGQGFEQLHDFHLFSQGVSVEVSVHWPLVSIG